jgi:hypothetical protein
MVAILIGERWNLNLVLICISFMGRDGEQFFMCFLAIWTSSLEKVLFSSPFLYWFIDFWGVQFFEFPVYSGYQSLV